MMKGSVFRNTPAVQLDNWIIELRQVQGRDHLGFAERCRGREEHVQIGQVPAAVEEVNPSVIVELAARNAV